MRRLAMFLGGLIMSAVMVGASLAASRDVDLERLSRSLAQLQADAKLGT